MAEGGGTVVAGGGVSVVAEGGGSVGTIGVSGVGDCTGVNVMDGVAETLVLDGVTVGVLLGVKVK